MTSLTYFMFFGLAILLAALAEAGILSYAAERLGIDRRRLALILLLCFLGSGVDLPLFRLPAAAVHSTHAITYFGHTYGVPFTHRLRPILVALNVGGALIPTGLAVYLMAKNRLYLQSLTAIVVVTVVVHFLARPVPGQGISIPVLVPPVTAAFVAALLSWKQSAALAYISGTLGTLLGADILNIGILQTLGGAVVSIGGAGTFDGVFLTGVLAMLLA